MSSRAWRCRRRRPISVVPAIAFVMIVAAFAGGHDPMARDLTLAQRVEAQRAIERVYFIHRSGSARQFEDAVPDTLLEAKVRTSLAQSVALEEFWNTPVTETMLRREVQRMIGGSRMPDRLRELRAALGNDDRLLAETLARETLVDRLCRAFLRTDSRVETHDWDAWWTIAAHRFDPMHARTVVGESIAGGAIDWSVNARGEAPIAPDVSVCALQDLWGMGHSDVLPKNFGETTPIWTGSEMIAWGSQNINESTSEGSRYDPATDTWAPTRLLGAPSPRYGFTTVWAGSEMIVWGGINSRSLYENTGARYDPVANTWTPTSIVGAPAPTADHVAVWTGSRMVVWGGDFTTSLGGRYDPATDTWQPTSTVNASRSNYGETAVWTGTEMLVWGGETTDPGGRYNPVSDTWVPISRTNAPQSFRYGHSMVWTGSRMVVWGGAQAGYPATGGQYDPTTDTWFPMSEVGAPDNRYYHTTVWTGNEMIVWGGYAFAPGPPSYDGLTSGGRYNPVTDSWLPTSPINTPGPYAPAFGVWTGDLLLAFGGSLFNGGRYRPATDSWTPAFGATNWPSPAAQPASVWSGAELIVWSGPDFGESGRYDPATDTWKTVQRTGAPSNRTGEAVVWVGNRMVLWGGSFDATPLDTGGRYSPLTDSWSAMPEDEIPIARAGHTAVRAGTRMIVWGGGGPGGLLADGALYDPGSNAWTPIPPDGAPAPRRDHAAVWTGSRMIVWGGNTGGGAATDTGGIFDPTANGGLGGWTATSTTGAPGARLGHTAVWSGTQMIVWGGSNDRSGGRYNPATDAWQPTTLSNAPAPRSDHTAVWTGSLMIVWGGSHFNGQFTDVYATGGVYDPAADIWTPTTITDAPEPRVHHVAAWTGQAMLIWGGSASGTIQDRTMRWYGNRYAGPLADLDGDGVSSCQDCDDHNAATWGVPGETTGLMFSDAVTLAWSPPADFGAESVEYDLLRSDVASDFTTAGVCVASGMALPSATDATMPDLGRCFFYLARARNACPGGIGSAGAGSSGVPRPALVCP